MRIPVVRNEDSSSAKRAVKTSGNSAKTVVISVVVVVVLILLIVGFVVWSRIRANRNKFKARRAREGAGPIAAPKAEKKQKWKWNWTPWKRSHEYSDRLQEPESGRAASRDREMTASTNDDTTAAAAATVDRNTSVRSVMTLPSYSTAARENERILAREGERGGVDTVLEFPETNDEEEQRREDEMASLYQIRLARRAEQREREERRRLRREARARGDHHAVAELRQRAESAASQNASQTLIAEHQAAAAARERRVSSVQYAELGVQRHDGTRLRANSTESDVRPLLDSSASIGGGSQTASTLNTHYRGPSASSIMTASTRASDEYDFPSAQRTTTGTSAGDDFEVISLQESRSRSISQGPPTPGIDTDIPHVSPPNYDDGAWEEAPPYTSPVNTRAPQLPNLERLPSIHVTQEPPTPEAGRSVASLHGQEPRSG